MLLTFYETKYRPRCPINKMLKGLLMIKLLFLLALQPAGIAFASGGDIHIQAVPENLAVFEIACEPMNSDDCVIVTTCLTSAHTGCDLNPFQPASDSEFTPHKTAAYLPSYGVSKLPLNETFPPLRPPKRS